MINSNFCSDPLTGLKNLFGLIDSEMPHICGENGVIVAMDIAGFEKINLDNGREVGDICIKTLAQLIVITLSEKQFDCSQCSIYRVGGDEFTIVLPGRELKEAAQLIQNIISSFKNEMLQNHNLLISLHTSVIPYGKPIASASELLKLANSSLRNSAAEPLPRWADQLIDDIISRTRETLTLLRHANKLALSDEISGLPNHRSAEIHLFKSLEKYNDDGLPFSILFIDGDNLRQYNQLGYQRGNQMIRDLAKLISSALRRDDIVFRWLSGDEFLVLLSGTERKDALKLGERIRSKIEAETQDFPFPVTVSIGVSSCPDDGSTISELLAKAESANLLAKNGGKNRVS